MKTFHWAYKGAWHESTVIEALCPKCGKQAVVRLPEAIRAEQLDGTTHVCHPFAGGCNWGFEGPPAAAEVNAAAGASVSVAGGSHG